LRRDDPSERQAFFKLAELQLASQHLVPLLTTYPDEQDVAYNACKGGTTAKLPVQKKT
jgi:hypothetical protein